MRKEFISIVLVILLSGVSYAGVRIDLNSNESLSVPTAVAMEWRKVDIDIEAKSVTIIYRWIDADGDRIVLRSDSRSPDLRWYCQDIPQRINPIDNTVIPAVTCFTDTFGFSIRAQDVGTTIGVGLRNLLWNKMKPEILTGGNDGTFQ